MADVERSRFSGDPHGEVALPDPFEVWYPDARGVWTRTPRFYWLALIGPPDVLVRMDTFLTRPNGSPVHHKEWSGGPFTATDRWNTVMGPMSFIPSAFGVYLLEVRVEGAEAQVQRISIAASA